MVSKADIERTGYDSKEALVEDMKMVYSLTDRPFVKHLAGTILHLCDEFPYDQERVESEEFSFDHANT